MATFRLTAWVAICPGLAQADPERIGSAPVPDLRIGAWLVCGKAVAQARLGSRRSGRAADEPTRPRFDRRRAVRKPIVP